MDHAILNADVVHDGWCTVELVTVRRPDGSTMKREIEDHGQAACVLPYDPVRRTAVLIRQFRTPVLRAGGGADELLEAIAGIIDAGESAEASARREAMEEAGLQLETLEPAACVWTMPGLSTERMHAFFARYDAASFVGPGGGLVHEHEAITVVEMELPALAAMADNGAVADCKTLLLVQTLRLRRPELFAP
ncbi:MAG: NUDIX domain-containing protein [Variibacter sp.]|nr:NUDIX domain-containing protein [Variibacter sp.]